MEIIEIEAFVTIAQYGGFTRAATALNISQPAISRRMELLERELGAPLFERVYNGVRLSEAGQTFLPYARQLLAAAKDGVEAVKELKEEYRGTITLALVGSLASTTLTGQLQRFRANHPQVKLVLHTARSHEVSRLVQQGEATLGLRYSPDPHPEIVSRLCYEEALVIVCAAQNRLANEAELSTEALAGVTWVTFPRSALAAPAGEPYQRAFERQLQTWGLEEEEVEQIEVDSLTAQKRLIEADFGIGLLPESSVVEELRLGTLRLLYLSGSQPTIPVMVIYRKQGFLSRASRQLLEDLAMD
jgi:DNA-binding transcriptional LysR family regulator